jgi:hypothetical protein
MHSEKLHNVYSSPNIRMIKSRMRWVVHVARMWTKRGAYRVLVGKSERKRPLGRPRHRWEDNIKMDLKYDGGGGARTALIELIWLRIGTSGWLL